MVRAEKRFVNAVIVLEMDERDAEVLLAVCDRIGGRSDGPRAAMDRIMDALTEVGVERFYDSHDNWGNPAGLYFSGDAKMRED